MALRATATTAEPELLFLPWDTPLEQWPADICVAMPRGISRHIVRFVRLNGMVYAIKETEEHYASREYDLLFELGRMGAPCVEPVGVIAGRTDPGGEPIQAAIITRHLSFSLPYRALMSRANLTWETGERLLDALVVLLVRLHLLGFSWNDCSLSNTLFRRDAGTFAAYLVDAETGELREKLSRGQRRYDIETASMNVMGELMDLQAGGLLPEDFDPLEIGEQLVWRYDHLWMTLTEPVTVSGRDRYQIQTLIRTLNGLGFDVAEMTAEATDGGNRLRVTPKVVDAGYYRRRMRALTGLEMHENQAHRLLNDLLIFRYTLGADEDELTMAHRWVSEVYEAILARIPRDLRAKLEPAEEVWEVLQHRWWMSQRSGEDVSLAVATDHYVQTVLRVRPSEAAVLGPAVDSELVGDEVDDD